MRKLRLSWGLLALSAILTFTSCQKGDAIDPALDSFASEEFQLEDLDALENTDVTNGSESAAFGISSTEAMRSERHSLSSILPKLDLNQRQRAAISGFAKDHAACVKELRDNVQELHRNLLAKANAVREKYIADYRAGNISRAELEKRLTTLRERVRSELNKDDRKLMHMRALRKCRLDLMTNIESVLNREQRQLWDRWKQSLQQR
jgi:hypothetical protein